MGTVKMIAFRSHQTPTGAVVRKGKEFELDEKQAKAYQGDAMKHLGGPLGDGDSVADGELPKDFPGRKALVALGLKTPESLEGMTKEQLGALKGIGEATADQILEALKD